MKKCNQMQLKLCSMAEPKGLILWADRLNGDLILKGLFLNYTFNTTFDP